MTTTATATYAQHPCPKCGGKLYDNRQTKTNPKSPDFKCSNYKSGCDFVEWPPKVATPKLVAPPAKPAVMASKPNAELPPLLQNQEEEDAAELASKVGIDLTKFSKDLALYTALTEFVTEKIAPIYADNSVGIGMSPESAVAAVATLYIQAKRTP